jgi:protein O-GlcNAc transferase
MKRHAWASLVVIVISTISIHASTVQNAPTRINPGQSKIQFIIGQSHMMAGSELTSENKPKEAFVEYDAAADSFKKAIEFDPNHVEAYLALADDYMNYLSQSDFALTVLNKLRAIKPQDDSVVVLIGIANYNLDRFDESLKAFTEATKATTPPASASEAHYWIGRILSERKRYSEAIRHLTVAVRLKPQYADAFDEMGIAYYGLKRYAEAIAGYKEAIRLVPDEVDFYSGLYFAYRDSGDKVLARETREKIRTMDPKLYQELVRLGGI